MTSKVVTFGESLLRLAPSGFERFLQTPHFSAVFGGAEANVAVALSSFGADAAYVTVLPENNPIADAALAEIRRFGVDVSKVIRSKGRLGLYYLEFGANQRPGRVVYDREHSSIALAKPGDIHWQQVFQGARWFHITGITAAISASAADLSIEAMRQAQAMGLTVSLDFNYRRNLWNWGRSAQQVMGEMIGATDILIANEEHLRTIAGLPTPGAALKAYPKLKAVALTLRTSDSASKHCCSATLTTSDELLNSRTYEIGHSVDPIGAGDAFAAGLIYGWLNFAGHQEALDFAVAANCLKHSIPGDFLRATVDEVRALMSSDGSARLQR